jgi:hypothetical protein
VADELASLEKAHVPDSAKSRPLSHEEVYWIPTEALNLLQDFVIRHVPSLAPAAMERFAISLNGVWLAREERVLERMRRQYGKGLQHVRRRVENARSYDAVMSNGSIKRLERQVKDMRVKALQRRRLHSWRYVL